MSNDFPLVDEVGIVWIILHVKLIKEYIENWKIGIIDRREELGFGGSRVGEWGYYSEEEGLGGVMGGKGEKVEFNVEDGG